jgi:hypothetical protein
MKARAGDTNNMYQPIDSGLNLGVMDRDFRNLAVREDESEMVVHVTLKQRGIVKMLRHCCDCCGNCRDHCCGALKQCISTCLHMPLATWTKLGPLSVFRTS